MTGVSENNKRIAKNTLMLYIRMLLSVVVSLYTSRVVLNTLGTSDYGIYCLVGGVVSMFGFLNSAMSGSTSRFLTFEMGRGDFEKLKATFSSALIVHVGIALFVFVLAETIGLWLLVYKLNIPDGRMLAAHIVYQASVLSAMLTITQVPYNASIIAHEKMDVYAYVELLNVFLKLAIVFCLLVGDLDKLVLYAILVLAVSALIALIYRIYCIKHFAECHFQFQWRPELIKPLLSFSAWGLVGNVSETVNLQGTSLLLNMFFGTVLNAASGIANTVQGIIRGFAFNVITAFRPQIIKSYAEGNIEYMEVLLTNAAKYSSLLFLILCVPLYAEADYVLSLWLGVVPAYTASFLRISLISAIFAINYGLLCIPIGATGFVKYLNISTGAFNLLVLIIIYIVFHVAKSPLWAYSLIIPTYLGIFFANCFWLKTYIPLFRIWAFIYKAFLHNTLALTILIGIIYVIQHYFRQSFFRLLSESIISVFVFLTYYYVFVLSRPERVWIHGKVSKFF